MSGTSGVPVSRLCVRCHRWTLRWLTSLVQDAYGSRPYVVCMECERPDDRRPRR